MLRNYTIIKIASTNHRCADALIGESILRFGPLRIPFQQPQPLADFTTDVAERTPSSAMRWFPGGQQGTSDDLQLLCAEKPNTIKRTRKGRDRMRVS